MPHPASTRFAVDAVEPARERLPEEALGLAFPQAVYLAPGRETLVVRVDHMPVLLGAVHRAFSDHRPLVLGPDILWLTIMQGVAQHVGLFSKELRERLGAPKERQTLTLKWNAPLPENDDPLWGEIVAGFRAKLVGEIGEGRGRLLTCDYSTTTEVERTASEIVLLDMYARYFDYALTCVCGIPTIEVHGTVADYQKMAAKLRVLRELDLGFWVDSLEPIVAGFEAAAGGEVDLAFWQGIYKPRVAYGAEQITGWIGRLYPYCGDGGRYEHRNPQLEMSHAEVVRLNAARAADEDLQGPSITAGSVPNALSSFVVTTDTPDESQGGLTFEGGPLYISQHEDGALKPRGGYLVRRGATSTAHLVQRIRGSHTFTPAERRTERERPFDGSALLYALYDAFDGASLFGGKLDIVRKDEARGISLPGLHCGREIARAAGWVIAEESRSFHIVRLAASAVVASRAFNFPVWPGHETSESAEEIMIISASLSDFLTHVLDHEGELPGAMSSAAELAERLSAELAASLRAQRMGDD